jgi:hypothetical protein
VSRFGREGEQAPLHLAVAFAREAGRISRAGWCSVCVQVMKVGGASIVLMDATGQAAPLAVSSRSIAAVEDLQFTTGEGPSRDAFRAGTSLRVPAFDASAEARWPSFVDLATSEGIAAAFAYPLVVDGARVGMLTLYNDTPGDLDATQQADAMSLAEVLSETVRGMAHLDPAVRPTDLDIAIAYRAETYQASGMVAAQLQISTEEALLRIRAYSFSTGRPVGAIASDIINRRLRLAGDQDPLEGV